MSSKKNYPFRASLTKIARCGTCKKTRRSGVGRDWRDDFAYGQDKKWYLIDIAEGDRSFHWLDCKFCPEDLRIQYKKENEYD